MEPQQPAMAPTQPLPSFTDQPSSSANDDAKSSTGKAPVIRGARACTVCRAAKMKCVGADDGSKCQRCKRSGQECIFEKHRRGRKPGSKLSEASKMLRRLEKGLNSAKMKSQHESMPFASESGTSGDRFANNELPPLQIPPDYENGYSHPVQGSSRMAMDEDEDDVDRNEENLYPARLISKENERNSFFKTILNPEPYEPRSSRAMSDHGHSSPSPPRISAPLAPPPNPMAGNNANSGLQDPITAGLIDEADALKLFDLFFLRLNPFINLFDPALHSVHYVRSRSPFLFTTLIMACCKFFMPDKPNLYATLQSLANEYARNAFADLQKSVEVVQAFACLTYWQDRKEPGDSRTWTYIGYACRMAIELGLNRYVGRRDSRVPHENELQMRERRNRERTFLVLFVHDRSLSTQTGRDYMLHVCDLVRHSATWHQEGGGPCRPEDVIIAAFVQLRQIASDAKEEFHNHKDVGARQSDLNYDLLLRKYNLRLQEWRESWQKEMQKANGDKFHFAFLDLFRSYVRLFVNSYGVQSSLLSTSRTAPSLNTLSICYESGLENLRIVTDQFQDINMLRYGQETITVMTAYAAIVLLKLLASSNTLAELHEGAPEEIIHQVEKTAEAYFKISHPQMTASSSAHHARFLRTLVAKHKELFRTVRPERYQDGSRLGDGQGSYGSSSSNGHTHSPPQTYHQAAVYATQPDQETFHFPASPTLPPMPLASSSLPRYVSRDAEFSPGSDSTSRSAGIGGYTYPAPATPYSSNQPASDYQYWNLMFKELGFGDGSDLSQPVGNHYTPNPVASIGGVSSFNSSGYQEGSARGASYSGHYQHSYAMNTFPPPSQYGR